MAGRLCGSVVGYSTDVDCRIAPRSAGDAAGTTKRMPLLSMKVSSGFREWRSHRTSKHAVGVGSSPTQRVFHLGS